MLCSSFILNFSTILILSDILVTCISWYCCLKKLNTSSSNCVIIKLIFQYLTSDVLLLKMELYNESYGKFIQVNRHL